MRRAALFVIICASMIAQAAGSDVQRATQRGGTFVAPPRVVDPVYLPSGPNATPTVAQGAPLQLRLALELPLRTSGTSSGSGTQGSYAALPSTLQLQLSYRPLADSGYFARVNFYDYLESDKQQPWNPDYTYAFGYERFEPGTFSLVYSNYTGTRLRPSGNEARFNFPQGAWSGGYKFGVPEALERIFLVGDGDSALCNTNLNYTPRYTVATGPGLEKGKTAASAGCRYTRPEGWHVHFTGLAYPDRSQRQPWDPDYTYGFGYTFGAGPGYASLQYNNYSGNRFSGGRAPGEGRFIDGSVTLSWTSGW